MENEVKYYESHITIEPVFDARLTQFKMLTAIYGFKAADLLMQKDREATETRSDKDTFCTGKSTSLAALRSRMGSLITLLNANGFTVWRAKIEAIIYDERLA